MGGTSLKSHVQQRPDMQTLLERYQLTHGRPGDCDEIPRGATMSIAIR